MSDGPTYDGLRAAWEKMKEPQADRPLVFSPDELALLEEHGLVSNGRVDRDALHAYLRQMEWKGW